MEQQNSTGDAPDAANSIWRHEVHARVAGYRSRRGRRLEGAFSMRFPFPPAEPASVAPAEASFSQSGEASPMEGTDVLNDNCSFSPATAETVGNETPSNLPEELAPEASPPNTSQDYAEMPAQPARRSRRKVIEFPKPAIEASRLWDEPSLPERPRILDVAEELPAVSSTPLLDGLVFPSHESHAAAPADHVELPLQAVPLGQRLYAGAVDCALVAAAAGVFAAAGYRLLPKLPTGKPMLLACAALPALLWAVYQYIFLVYGGTTLGMQWASVRLSSFKGGFPTRRQRRNRVISLYFSTASLMMGLLWALVDVDRLCWHDRISRTYLTKGSD